MFKRKQKSNKNVRVEEPKRGTHLKKQKKVKTVRPKRKIRWSVVIKLIITIAIIVAAVYGGFIAKDYLDGVNQKLNDIVTNTKETQTKQDDLENQQDELKTKQDELENKQTELEEKQKELEIAKAEKKAEEERLAKEKAEAEEKARQEAIRIAQADKQQVTSRSSSSIRTATGTTGEYQNYAKDLCLNTYGWSEYDFECLVKLWNKESGWNPNAHNKSSGAHGIPQSLPASKMASEGNDYYTNGYTQIRWGLKYIKNRYGTPAKAWQHSQNTGWY